MKLSDSFQKVKVKIKPFENDLILVIAIILVAFISFGLGRLSRIKEDKASVIIENVPETNQEAQIGDSGSNSKSQIPAQGEKIIMASKNGTKYYYPWCAGASRIKEENKVWFSSKEEAQKAGYQPAANCKGL